MTLPRAYARTLRRARRHYATQEDFKAQRGTAADLLVNAYHAVYAWGHVARLESMWFVQRRAQ